MSSRVPRRLCGVLCGLAVVSCGEGSVDRTSDATVDPARVVAVVGGEPVTADDLEGVGPVSTEADRRRRLETVIARRLAANEARLRGLDDEDTIAGEVAALRASARDREEALLRDALYRRVRDDVEIPDEELRRHYDQTKHRYPERQILLREAAFASRGEAEAADAALGTEGRLVPGASEDVGPVAVKDLSARLLPEVLRLDQPGERVIVEREEGAWLVELVEVLPAVPLPFEEVRDRVEKSLRTRRGQAAFREVLDDARARADVEVREDRLRDDSLWDGAPASSPIAATP